MPWQVSAATFRTGRLITDHGFLEVERADSGISVRSLHLLVPIGACLHLLLKTSTRRFTSNLHLSNCFVSAAPISASWLCGPVVGGAGIGTLGVNPPGPYGRY